MPNSFKDIAKQLENASAWQQKYRQIMLFGKQLPALPDQLKVESALVPGCESRVWLYVEFAENENTLVIVADSDTRIVKGLLAITLALYNGLTPEQVANINAYDEFERLGLIKHLSPSRGNGVKAIVERIHAMALARLG